MKNQIQISSICKRSWFWILKMKLVWPDQTIYLEEEWLVQLVVSIAIWYSDGGRGILIN